MPWSRRYWIHTRERWTRVLDVLREFAVDFARHPLQITVEEYVPGPSPGQRSLFHVVCSEAAPHFGYTPGEFKSVVKDIYFGTDWRALHLSTEDLDDESYGFLIETAYRLCSENGLFLQSRRST